MAKQFKNDLFSHEKFSKGNFSDLNNRTDHYFAEPILGGLPDRSMIFDEKDMIMWAINDYLGLASNPTIIAAAGKSASTWGLSTPMGARKLTGTTHQHILLEQKLAHFLQKPKGHLSNYGYLGVMGAINCLTSANDAILVDSHSHSCIIDGSFLAKERNHTKIYPFKHNDIEDLERQLTYASEDCTGGALIVTEGVFGMSGELAKLKDICQLKKQFNARLFLDDAHGFGVMGDNGRGTGEHLKCQDDIDIYFGTFAKAFVGIGSIIAADEEVASFISYNARTDLSSKSIPLAMIETLLTTLDFVKKNEFREKMWRNARKLQQGMLDLGFTLGSTESPITAIKFFGERCNIDLGKKILHALREEFRVFCVVVAYPIVPKGVLVFRLIPTANHTEEDISRTIDAFAKLNDRFHLTD